MQFKEDTHQYIRHGDEYISVTTLIKKYEPPFDTDYWSTYKAVKDVYEGKGGWSYYKKKVGGWENVVAHYRENGDIPSIVERIEKRREAYIKQWAHEGDIARKKGTLVHKALERSTKEMDKIETMDGVILFPSDKDILELQDFHDNGTYPELIIYNDEYRIAGTADLVNKRKDRLQIIDYKTSKEITRDAFMEECLCYPLEHIPNANYYVYSLQLSLYAWMLEQRGYKITSLAIEHRNRNNGKWINTYPVEYRKQDVETMLNHYKTF